MNFTNFANLSIFIFILFYTKTENSRCLFQSQKCIIIESHPIIYILLYIWCIYEICQYCRCRLRPSASCVCACIFMWLLLLLYCSNVAATVVVVVATVIVVASPVPAIVWPMTPQTTTFSVAYNYDLLLFYYYINLSNLRNDEKIKSILNP